ncbi:MAG TPA: protein kinase, partial [Gemmatimonadaceae bacterium]
AMTRVLQFVALTPADEMLLRDARAIRSAAEDLLKASSDPAPRSADGGVRHPHPKTEDQRPRVLVADDSLAQRDLLRRFLKRLDCDVIDARDGATALGIAQHEHLDLIITDVNMPQLDGLALLKELKASLTTCDIPVIVVSGEGGLQSVVDCIAHGAEDHLAKPYESTLLTARVKASLERKRMRDVERQYLRRVAQLTEAAKAADRDGYVPGSLDLVAAADDELGSLARVFDRLVSGMRSREDRLKHRLVELRREMTESSERAVDIELVPDVSPFGGGEIAGGRYKVIGQVGSGGMGMVYHARDMELGEDVALKVVRRNLVAADPAIVTRLKSEVRLARKISHRNVARTHDFGEWDGTYFISMEYVEGISVSDLLDRRGRLSISSTLAIGTQLVEALAVAHEQQIIHRDIKPANLIVDNAGVLKVMDFGIAKSIERDERITLGGFVVGTPHYMAPEQLVGGVVDERSDLYAVGVVLYECLTGRTPFDAESEQALMSQLSAGTYVAVGELVRDVPRDLEALIHQQLRFRAADRIPSARDLAHRLSEIELRAQAAS